MNGDVIRAQRVFDVQRASERATYDHGWLRTSHSFSFASTSSEEASGWRRRIA